MSNLNNNTTQLELLLQKVNELPAAGSGGGEDVTAETNEYTSLNTELEEVINSLPEAGGGGSIETYTVNFSSSMSNGFTFIERYVHYVGKECTSQVLHIDVLTPCPVQIEAIKDSVIFCTGGSNTAGVGIEILGGGTGAYGYKVISNNASIVCKGGN